MADERRNTLRGYDDWERRNTAYRIYDKYDRRWRDDMVALPDGSIAVLSKRPLGYKVDVVWQEDLYVVQRDTGMTDADGAYVFEGDEVQMRENRHGTVSWVDEIGMYAVMDNDAHEYFPLTNESCEMCLVIGNVFDGYEIQDRGM